ncbi:hypothetical protein [Enterococcus olivae]
MKTTRIQIAADDLAMILNGILHGEDERFEEVLDRGFDGIEALADELQGDTETVFTINKVQLGE